jgi:hypothetical protein
LMRDLAALCNHFGVSSPNLTRKVQIDGEGEGEGEGWQQTEAGMELWAALGQAKTYFADHPNWLEERLQPIAKKGKKDKPPRRRRRRGERGGDLHSIPFLPMTVADVNTVQQKNSVVDADTVSNMAPPVNSLEYSDRVNTVKGSYFACNRQSSLPTSLCNTHPPPSITYTVPTIHQLSRSMDSFPSHPTTHSGGTRDFGEGSTCLLCQQQQEGGWVGGRRWHCPRHQQLPPPAFSDTDGDSELEFATVGIGASVKSQSSGGVDPSSRSKSMPSVAPPHGDNTSPTPHLVTSRTAIEGLSHTGEVSRSRTVLQAEVHKEWDGTTRPAAGEKSATFPQSTYPNAPPPLGVSVQDSRGDWDAILRQYRGRANSADTSSVSSESSCSSYSHSGSDSLERDLRSITVPRVFDHSCVGSFAQGWSKSPSSSALGQGADLDLAKKLPPPPYTCLSGADTTFTFDLSTWCPSAQEETHEELLDNSVIRH